MEKAKRGASRKSLWIIRFLLAVIGILTAVLVVVVLTIQSDPTMPNQVVVNDIDEVMATSCAPTQRTYRDLVNPSDSNAQFTTSGQTKPNVYTYAGGGNAIALTQPAQAGIAATSVVTMNNSSNQNQAIPTMTAPATYTPMPMGTLPPPNQQNQANIVGTPAPYQQPVTELQNAINAGEIDDNVEWDVYMTYRDNFHDLPANTSPVDNVDVSQRQLIYVNNSEGQPILGSTVEILTMDGQILHTACTYATGYTMFFPKLHESQEVYQVRVSKGDATTEAELNLSEAEWTLTLDVEQESANLDILFLIDATGSMDDEIAQLTNNILYISEQIRALPDEIDVRYGLVSYKDGNYHTQVWDFTPNVQQFQSQLAQLYTAGGAGETLNDGLDKAVHAVQWRGDDTVKLVFLVGDEPPGVYEQHPSYAKTMLLAGQAGIKVHPIASSGLDVQGEYIFRQIAQATMGNFIFLTYGSGQTAVQGTGDVVGSVGEEDFGEYSVEQLHEIVLNLIRDELAHQGQ